jgi:hypothetical protein
MAIRGIGDAGCSNALLLAFTVDYVIYTAVFRDAIMLSHVSYRVEQT